MRAVILAGGFGTRLRPIIGNEPKCMAPYMGRPMITFIIKRLRAQGIDDITLALHYKAEKFVDYLKGLVKFKIEEVPLGTGGAIKNCIEGDEPFLVVNGDTISAIDYNDMIESHSGLLTIARTPDRKSAGIYIIDPKIFENSPEGNFSFENDIVPHVEKKYYEIPWFKDLGTPETYSSSPKDWV